MEQCQREEATDGLAPSIDASAAEVADGVLFLDACSVCGSQLVAAWCLFVILGMMEELQCRSLFQRFCVRQSCCLCG